MSSAADALLGQTLDGRYRVLRTLAEGGMATVYLALDERLDREIALKVMRSDLARDPSFVSRFQREARAAASLSHPHVVAVHDQGEDGEHIFLAMEYVAGRSLREVLTQEGPLSPRAALDNLDAVLQALAVAHGKGLIHRDVKPENVIISDHGTVKVADFGLARAVSSQTVTGSTGTLLGTVAYLSPEQVESGVADARSDVYSAGLVLFEMLTGAKAFTGDSPIHVAYQHVHGGVPAPSQRIPDLPPELDDLVAVATARDPEQRPVDARDFLLMVRRTRTGLGDDVLDARPEGAAAVAAAAVATRTTALPQSSATDSAATTVLAPGAAAAGAVAAGAAAAAAGAANAAGTQVAPAPSASPTTAMPHGVPLQGVVVPPQQARRRRWWPLVLVLLVLAALIGGWYLILGPGAMTTVPRVSGLSQADAVSALSTAGLSAHVEDGFSEDVPVGDVISSDPTAGREIRKNSAVALLVSKGPERYSVPDVTGKSRDEATDLLTSAHLTVGEVTEAYDEKVPQGQVVSSDPKAGTSLKPDDAVALVISKGRQPITVPDYTGKSAADAQKALTDLGLSVDAGRTENSDTVPQGNVISQDPRGGTLYKGDQVTLVVSKGPVMVDVPNVIGMPLKQATKTLEDVGFKVKVERAFGGIFGTVRFQDPADGTAPKGSTVTVTIV